MKRFLTTMVAGLAFAAPVYADGHAYPSDTIHVVVPWRAGGGTDSIARGFAAALEEQVEVAVVVDNLTGGVGDKAHKHVIASDPDGLQILFNGSSDMNSVTMFRGTDYDYSDFACVGGVFDTPTWILSHKDRGITSIADLLEVAKNDPEGTIIGVGAAGSTHAIMGNVLFGNNDVEARIVPFDGGGPLKKAILANQVTAGIIHSPVLLDAVKAGDVNVVGAGASLENITYEPLRGTETLKDHNVDIEIGVVRGMYLPKSTPEDVRAAVEAIAEKAAKSDTFRDFAVNFGFEPVWIPGAEFCDMMAAENAAYKDIKAKYID